jgi:hypothetical protein|tara:strand:+ start:3863 stop:4060 length:198 start_codon:yes stop_codon:yes gene_type:complete
MKNNFTLLEVLGKLTVFQGDDTKKTFKTDSKLSPDKETIKNIVAYANSVRCHKTKLLDKVLLVLN